MRTRVILTVDACQTERRIPNDENEHSAFFTRTHHVLSCPLTSYITAFWSVAYLAIIGTNFHGGLLDVSKLILFQFIFSIPPNVGTGQLCTTVRGFLCYGYV